VEIERLARDYVSRHPEHGLLVAAAIAQQGKVTETLDFAEGALPKADVASLTGGSLPLIVAAGLSTEQAARLDRALQTIADKNGRPVPLLMVIGKLRLRLRPQDAAEVFREVLKKDENNADALNDMAVVLILQNQNIEEAMSLIDRAIAIAGPLPYMLDTRAAVRLANRQGEEALADLEEAIVDDPRPVVYFHQALAFWRLGRTKAAADAFRVVRQSMLKPEDLFVPERANYEELQRMLPP
jgi:cellulose synthase operon protein C